MLLLFFVHSLQFHHLHGYQCKQLLLAEIQSRLCVAIHFCEDSAVLSIDIRLSQRVPSYLAFHFQCTPDML